MPRGRASSPRRAAKASAAERRVAERASASWSQLLALGLQGTFQFGEFGVGVLYGGVFRLECVQQVEKSLLVGDVETALRVIEGSEALVDLAQQFRIRVYPLQVVGQCLRYVSQLYQGAFQADRQGWLVIVIALEQGEVHALQERLDIVQARQHRAFPCREMCGGGCQGFGYGYGVGQNLQTALQFFLLPGLRLELVQLVQAEAYELRVLPAAGGTLLEGGDMAAQFHVLPETCRIGVQFAAVVGQRVQHAKLEIA